MLLRDIDHRLSQAALESALDFAFKANIGKFATSSFLPDAPSPGLALTPIGAVGLPLNAREADLIVSCARAAPFGKGVDTVVDTEVRRTWQVDKDSVEFQNPEWKRYMRSKVLPEVCKGLAQDPTKVQAKFYKLLLYPEGGHFKAHQEYVSF